ncbi:MAG: transglutaminase-like domain-containing protein [Syntrophobacterales bacterium]|nr:transglutaminase-like domain-containing protein [Syntrophobacterales bacterium]
MKKSGAKWRYYGTGGGVILLFLILLFFRLGIPDKIFRGLEKQTHVTDISLSSGEVWMEITQNQQKIGYALRRRVQTEKGSEFSEDIFMKVNTMGVIQPVTIHTQANLKPGGELSGFQFALGSSLFKFAAEGTIENGKMSVRMGDDNKERVLPLPAPVYLGGSVIAAAGRGELKQGEQRSFPLFDPASLSSREVKITSLGEDKLTVRGKAVSARKLALDFMGMKQVAWVSPDGVVLREEGILGIVLQEVSKKEALSGLDDAAGSDFTAAAAIPVSPPIDDAPGLKILTVRLHNLPAGHFLLEGGRQTYRDGLLTVHHEKELKQMYPFPGVSENPDLYLKEAPFIEADNLKIRRKVSEIVAASADEMTKAEKLVRWLHKSIAKRPVLSVPDALQTLENMVGDCNEHAVLLAAMGRAAGLPTEIETGLVYMRGSFFFHAWNVFYIKKMGGWVTADATLGQMPADVTHLRFARGSLEKQMDMTGLIGRLKLEIVRMER